MSVIGFSGTVCTAPNALKLPMRYEQIIGAMEINHPPAEPGEQRSPDV